MVREIVKLIRPWQWTKNGFVFLPLLFGGYIGEAAAWREAVVVFFTFCFASSGIYSLNDIIDREADRQHPKKCRRPVASGAITVLGAVSVMVIMLLACIAVLWVGIGANSKVWLTVGCYLLLNMAYCIDLKKRSIVDICCVAIGFVLRVEAGGMASGIELSHWIVMMTFLLTLYIATAKRYYDVVVYEAGGKVYRKGIVHYNADFLNIVMAIVASITIVCYIMYTLSPEVLERIGERPLYPTTIFVIVGILRFLQKTVVHTSEGCDPTYIILHDRFIQLCLICWGLSFLYLIYW